MRFRKTVKKDVQQWQNLYPRQAKVEKRSWLHIDMQGISQSLEVPKQVIMRRAHLPARDLRLLDPLLAYPSTILGREHAIVANLEHIKIIITAHEVFLLDANKPRVAQFVKELKLRLPSNHSNEASLYGSGCDHDNPQCTHHREDGDGVDTPTTRFGSSWLPFEFQALEACLEAACQCLESEASTLADQAQKALDSLITHVSASNLEVVRQVKNRLVLISGRVQRVRDEIEQLLDDDGDMAEMYLTDKLLREQSEGGLPSPNLADTLSLYSNSTNHPDVALEDPNLEGQPSSPTQILKQPKLQSPLHSPRSPTRLEGRKKQVGNGHSSNIPSSATSPTSKQTREPLRLVTFPMNISNEDSLQVLPRNNSTMSQTTSLNFIEVLTRNNSTTSQMTGLSSSLSNKNQDVEELECLLEAYFVLIDGIIHHLASVKEYIDDTEDYVKIMLDDHQNNLLKLNIMMTISCLVISLFNGVAGLFGMNIQIPLFKEGGPHDFWRVVGWGSFASIVLSGSIIGWCKYTHFI